jgi:GGDEF domain-containing protein
MPFGGRDMFSGNHIFMREDFLRLLDLEIRRARRYQNLFGLLKFELQNRAFHGMVGNGKSLKFVLKLLSDELRETDVLGQTNENEVMVILPYCDPLGSETVHRRLSDILNELHLSDRGVQVQSRCACFPKEGTDMEEMLTKLETTNGDDPSEPRLGSTRERL